MRILAHIIFEADSALRFGCGDFNMLYDSPIQRDFNGLPLILGTSICGVIRANAKEIFSQSEVENLFGFSNGKEDSSSKIIFSNALLLDEKMQVSESLIPFSTLAKSKFLSHFLHLPQRQHNAIGYQGISKDGAKFDEEVIFQGTRFKCALEMKCENKRDKEDFFKILSLFYSPYIRFGAGSTKGFGVIKALEIHYEILQNPFSKSSSLNQSLSQIFTPQDFVSKSQFTHYALTLTPENVFLFGSGFGDEDADSIAVSEKVVDYAKGTLSKAKLLIPASSIKGAISQRTKFYINQHLGNFIDSAESSPDSANVNDSKSSQIHATLFGSANSQTNQPTKGQILVRDMYLDYDEKRDSQIFVHNSIDRFSASVVDGALFQEKATFVSASNLCIDIFVATSPIKSQNPQDFATATNAFEKALIDICNGALPLGAMSSKGHGFFSGDLHKNGTQIHTNKNGAKL